MLDHQISFSIYFKLSFIYPISFSLDCILDHFRFISHSRSFFHFYLICYLTCLLNFSFLSLCFLFLEIFILFQNCFNIPLFMFSISFIILNIWTYLYSLLGNFNIWHLYGSDPFVYFFLLTFAHGVCIIWLFFFF